MQHIPIEQESGKPSIRNKYKANSELKNVKHDFTVIPVVCVNLQTERGKLLANKVI